MQINVCTKDCEIKLNFAELLISTRLIIKSFHNFVFLFLSRAQINVDLAKEKVLDKWEERNVKEVHLTSRLQLLVVAKAVVKPELKMYNPATGRHILDLPEFGIYYYNRLAVTADGRSVIAIRKNCELVIWDLDTGEATVVARLQPANGVYVGRGDFVATIGSDGMLRIYDARESADEDETAVTDSMWMLTAAADNRHVIACGTVKMKVEIAVWDTLAGAKVRSIKAGKFPYPLCMLNDKVGVGRIDVAPTKDNFDHYKLLDFEEGKTLRVLQGNASKRRGAFGLIDGKKFIGLSRGRRNLKVWDIGTGKVKTNFTKLKLFCDLCFIILYFRSALHTIEFLVPYSNPLFKSVWINTHLVIGTQVYRPSLPRHHFC